MVIIVSFCKWKQLGEQKLNILNNKEGTCLFQYVSRSMWSNGTRRPDLSITPLNENVLNVHWTFFWEVDHTEGCGCTQDTYNQWCNFHCGWVMGDTPHSEIRCLSPPVLYLECDTKRGLCALGPPSGRVGCFECLSPPPPHTSKNKVAPLAWCVCVEIQQAGRHLCCFVNHPGPIRFLIHTESGSLGKYGQHRRQPVI